LVNSVQAASGHSLTCNLLIDPQCLQLAQSDEPMLDQCDSRDLLISPLLPMGLQATYMSALRPIGGAVGWR
jgi:hypothetical protein